MSDCKCKQPCGPCSNNCPDDGEIIESTILDPEDCNTNCCGKKCNDNCGINIQSTNDCLVVDTSECGVIKLTAECPKPTYVKAGNNITVRDVTPPSDCYIDGGDCSVKGGWEISSTDETVKACGGDTTPGYLNQKLDAGNGIVIDEINCGGGDAYLRIGIKDGVIPEIPDIPDVVVNYSGGLLNITQSGEHNHIINISDVADGGNFYDNTVMLGFFHNKTYAPIAIDKDGNAEKAVFIEANDWAGKGGWDMYTGNKKLATENGIKIKQTGYYYVYGQVTVVNNWTDSNKFLNLGRGLLKLNRNGTEYLVATAKHGAYGTFIAAKGGKGINVAQDGTISLTRGTVNTDGEGGTYEVNFENGGGMQPTNGFDGPWATLNMGVYLDLREGDILTVGYRPQSDIPAATANQPCSFRLTGQDDTTTTYKTIFGGTAIGLHPITPTVFMPNSLWGII